MSLQTAPSSGRYKRLADGEDRTVGAEEAGEAALHALELLVVAPVEVVPLGHDVVVGRQVDELAADAADLAVGEVAHQRGQRVLLELPVRVGEQDDVPPRLRHDLVEGAVLAAAGKVEDAHVRVGELARDGRRSRSVEPSDATMISRRSLRVVEVQAVDDLLADHVFFVVGGDDQRYARQAGGLAASLGPPQRSEQEEQHGIARVHVHDQAQAGPEDDGGECRAWSGSLPRRGAARTVLRSAVS